MRLHLPSGVTRDEVYMALKAEYREPWLKGRRKRLPSRVLASLIALLTGRRRKEIYLLERSHVDFRHGQIKWTIVKKRRPHEAIIPMGNELRHVLRTRRLRSGRPSHGYVVPRRAKDYDSTANTRSKRLHERAKKHGRNLRFHDLRHLVALDLLSRGAPLATVRALLQHSSPAMTLLYLEHSPRDLLAWVRR